MSATPDSPSSLRRATATIDDLTAALSNFSRIPSPEPLNVSTCCCGREECESSRAWAACKAKLESRLVLSAEVGQALLERHEAYVRKHETGQSESELEALDLSFSTGRTHEEVDSRVAGLVRENAVLEKRLAEALMNNEIVDLTHSSTLDELQAAKEKIAQLTAQNARYVGIDARLAVALQEKDDMQQERNSATQRARMAEARITSLKEKCSKLQAQVNRLREDLEMQRTHRQELSGEILSNARERLQQLQTFQPGQAPNEDEITEILESLVADNEALKRDNAELQNILSETREDFRALQEEVEEHRADGNRTGHLPHDSIAPALSPLQAAFAFQRPSSSSGKRAISAERRVRRGLEPLTPETTRRPLTPPDSQHTTSRWSALSRTRYAPSQLSAEIDEDDPDAERPAAHKSLLLLTRSKAVQTDGTGTSSAPSLFTTSPIPPPVGDYISSHEGQSDTSTLADANPSVLGVLIDRVTHLLNRLMQADALTLTTRLKRQHLVGADVPHLSRSTVNSIINENNALRTQFRAWLEDDKITTTCTRRDLRALFRLFKDVFNELGQLRVTMNDVILDPTIAGRVSELALNPSKAAEASSGEGSSTGATAPAWMAPLSKLLGLPAEPTPSRTFSPPTRGRTPTRPPPRVVPKREAALSASTTIVNVEFSGTGVGRAVTTTSTVAAEGPIRASASNGSANSPGEASRSVMNIFAGAPRATEPADPWVVIPKPQRASTTGTARRYDLAGGATIGRSAMRNAALAAGHPSGEKRLSRIVDAMIDPAQASTSVAGQEGEERDVVPDTLLERTLRPRGLSDSSIHTTYMAHEPEATAQRDVEVLQERPDRQSVLATLSRKVQRLASQSFIVPSRPFATTTPPEVSTTTAEPDAGPSRPQTPARQSPSAGTDTVSPSVPIQQALRRTASPGSRSLFPALNLSALASVLDTADVSDDGRPRRPQEGYVGDPRDETGMGRGWGRGL